MEITNFNKWFHCFVEWEEDYEKHLSCIPWNLLIRDKFSELFFRNNDEEDPIRWKWVPPWRVHVGNAE